jgi:hypothetical protein
MVLWDFAVARFVGAGFLPARVRFVRATYKHTTFDLKSATPQRLPELLQVMLKAFACQ